MHMCHEVNPSDTTKKNNKNVHLLQTNLTREHQLQALFGEATLVTSVFLDAGYKRTLEKKHWLQTYMGVGTLFTGVFFLKKIDM